MINFFKPKKAETDRLTIDGHEKLDPTPVALPVGFRRPETLAEQVARLVRSERLRNEYPHHESFEEADDFDIPDETFDPATPYETDFDIAAVRAMDHGVVSAPDVAAGRAASERLKKVKKPSSHAEPKDDE